jgi:hypothetical protein
MFLTGALAARREQAAEFWKGTSSLAFVESAAASAGLVVGLTARRTEK